MVKPPPTRTRAKAPVSLPSVNALSPTPADAKAAPLAPAPSQQASTPVPAKAPAAPVIVKAVAPAPAATAKVAAPAAVAAPPKAPAAQPKAPVAPPKKTVSAKLRIEKPVARVVAPKKPAPPVQASKTVAPKIAAPKAATPQVVVAKTAPAVAKTAVAKTAAAKPVVAKPVTVEAPKPAVRNETPVKSEPAVAPKPVAAAPKEPAKPASLESLPLPRPPEFATVATETVMSQALTMARAFGALQAKMLEHACAEFKAKLGEAETLARSDSASEAIALQAKAVRRSYESYAEHLKELARIANTSLRKD